MCNSKRERKKADRRTHSHTHTNTHTNTHTHTHAQHTSVDDAARFQIGHAVADVAGHVQEGIDSESTSAQDCQQVVSVVLGHHAEGLVHCARSQQLDQSKKEAERERERERVCVCVCVVSLSTRK
jgi:hypothetical protein